MKTAARAEDSSEESDAAAKDKNSEQFSSNPDQLRRKKELLEERLENIDDKIRWRNFVAKSGEISSGSKVSSNEETEVEALEAAFAEFTAFRYGTAYSEAFSEAPDLSLTKHEKRYPRKRTDL